MTETERKMPQTRCSRHPGLNTCGLNILNALEAYPPLRLASLQECLSMPFSLSNFIQI
jgi:hypothetical protein